MTWVRGLLIVLAVAALLLVSYLLLPPRYAAWLFYGLLFLLGLALSLLLLFPIYVEVDFRREGKDDHLHIGVRAAAGLLRLGYEIPVIALLEQSRQIVMIKEPTKQMPKGKRGKVTITVEKIEKFMRMIRRFRKRFGKFKRAILRLTKTYELHKYEWRTVFGTGDAAKTAYVAGLAWGLKGLIAGMVYRNLTVKQRLKYEVKPHFQAQGFRTELTCIIRFWIAKAMVATLILVFLWLREGIRWRNIRFKV
jgi:hypothetical protein